MSVKVFSELLGRVLVEILNKDQQVLTFRFSEGPDWVMYHRQSCCEWIRLEECIGEPEWICGSPLTMAEKVSQKGPEGEYGNTSTWTFYKFATVKGYVTLRWLGTSNGCYSEDVDFEERDEDSWDY